MATVTFEAPPSLQKSVSYEPWFKKLSIYQYWQKETRASHFSSLEEKARKSVFEFDVKDISRDARVGNIIACLNKLYLNNKTNSAWDLYFKSTGKSNLTTKLYVNIRFYIWVWEITEQNKTE